LLLRSAEVKPLFYRFVQPFQRVGLSSFLCHVLYFRAGSLELGFVVDMSMEGRESSPEVYTLKKVYALVRIFGRQL